MVSRAGVNACRIEWAKRHPGPVLSADLQNAVVRVADDCSYGTCVIAPAKIAVGHDRGRAKATMVTNKKTVLSSFFLFIQK
jgi:hypothetical protein